MATKYEIESVLQQQLNEVQHKSNEVQQQPNEIQQQSKYAEQQMEYNIIQSFLNEQPLHDVLHCGNNFVENPTFSSFWAATPSQFEEHMSLPPPLAAIFEVEVLDIENSPVQVDNDEILADENENADENVPVQNEKV